MTTKTKPKAPPKKAATASTSPIYDALVAKLGAPNLTPAPDYEVSAAQAVLALAKAEPQPA